MAKNKRTLETERTRVADLTLEVQELARKELKINNGQAFKTFHDMEENEPVLSASLMYLKSLLNRDFNLVPHKDSSEREAEVVNAINASLNNLNSYTKREFIGNVLTSLTYGCSLFETTFKRDGNIFVYSNITPIRVEDVTKWKFDQGKLEKVTVNNPYDPDDIIQVTNYEPVTIKADKLAFFRLFPDSNHPLGTSMLGPAYVPYKSKSVISQYQLIGVAKQFGNTLVLSAPEDYLTPFLQGEADTPESQYMDYLQGSMENLHGGAQSYAVIPSNVFDENGSRQFSIDPISKMSANDYTADSTIERLNNEMLIAMMSNILVLGSDSTGSYSLAEEKSNIVALFVKTIQATIADQLLKNIKVAFDLNNLTYDHLPSVEWESIEEPDWETVGKFYNRLASAGLITADEGLEQHLRDLAKAPKADYSKKLDNEKTADPVLRTSSDDKQL